MNRWLLALACAFALAGCGTTTAPYVKAGEGFAEAMDGAKAGMKLLADQRSKVARTAYADYLLNGPRADRATIDKEFVDFVCKGTGALAEERASLGVLGKYGKSINDLLKAPDKDVASLWESTSTVHDKMLALKLPKQSTEQADCASEVAGLLQMRMATIPETGLLGVFTTLQAVVAGINKATVAALTLSNEAARADALKSYIASNTATVAALVAKLETPSPEYFQLCDGADKGRPYCKIYTQVPEGAPADYVLPVPNKLTAQFLWQKWAALRQPYQLFQAFVLAAADAKTPHDRARAMDMALRVHRQLGEYDALRAAPSPQVLAQGVRESQAALVDLANGKMPPGTAWGIIMAWAGALGDFADGLTSAKDAIKGSE